MLGLVVDEREPGKPPNERIDGDLAFDAREGGAEAEVNAPAKGDVAVVGAGPIPAVGGGKLGGVAGRGAEEREYHLALSRPATARPELLCRDACPSPYPAIP